MFESDGSKIIAGPKVALVATVLAAGLLVCLALYPYLSRLILGTVPDESSVQGDVARMESVEGAGEMRHRSGASWISARYGMRLSEGDMIQTGKSGKAQIKYADGTSVVVPPETVFCVRSSGANVGGEVLSLSAGNAVAAPASSYGEQVQSPRSSPAALTGPTPENQPETAKAQEAQPTLEIHRIIPFGQSLEIIGHVEPGSSLTINGESVEVAGDGSFKHFTKPLPASVKKGSLVLRATDLAGRKRTVTVEVDRGRDPGEK